MFVSYFELDTAAFSGSGLLFLAAAAGTASFFSPCSFPLLVTLLAREIDPDTRQGRPTANALRFAAALSVGVTAFLLTAGSIIAVGAGPIVEYVKFASGPGRILRLIVGVTLIVLGMTQIRGLRFQAADRIRRPLQRIQARLRRKSPSLGFALFGFGYVLAGFG